MWQSCLGAVALVAMVIATGRVAASAQCCGDCDADGRITVSELITAVNHALSDCPVGTAAPTATPTLSTTATKTPTATMMRFEDRGDGTIADLVTGLIWEKKIGRDGGVDGFELHDADNRYPWGGGCGDLEYTFCRTDADCPPQHICGATDQQRTGLTIFRWLEEINREGTAGFAGSRDWRVPTVEELRTIRESTETPPMTNRAFDAEHCGTTCASLTNPACSCTAPDPHWTATEYAPDSARAWRVDFGHGDVLPNVKKDRLRVRAVRGP